MIYTVTLNPAIDRELTVSDFVFDTVLRSKNTRVDCGGKGFNVSRMLAALDQPSVALGFAAGNAGSMLDEMLASLGIKTAFTWVQGETRTNISIVTPQHDRYLKVNEPGPTVSQAEQEALLKQIQTLVQPGDWWVLAGNLPPGVPQKIYADMVTLIQASGGQVILDTSGEALVAGCAKRPFLIKPNETEASTLSGLPIQTAEEATAAAHKIRASGPQTVVISLGKKGAVLVDKHAAWLTTPPTIAERNPIGAGDSMVGGLVYALSQGKPLDEALRWGVASGAATASLSGTAVGTAELVASMLDQISIRQLNF